MRTSLSILALLLSNIISYAQENVTININVEGLLSRKGEISISVFDSPESYMKQPIKHLKTKLADYEGETFTLSDLPQGEYAIVVLHDENENGELDFGGMGPVEGYGFSNNPNAMFGPAKYEEALFTAEESVNMTIKLN